ncbi:Hpt domain-containing protein [Tropicimonas sp. S265A]|uniref:Hpt domain-containing protein n=1 Tax=Tropicimonas sp. S265A TaxID=3415134 RepID=UPI003C7EBFCD
MIDWERVEELISEIGSEDFGEVVELFLEEVDAAMGDLVAGGNVEATQQTLHLVKGCAWNLGFAELGKICAAQEDLGDPLSTATAAHLQTTYATSRAAFIDGLVARSITAPAA